MEKQNKIYNLSQTLNTMQSTNKFSLLYNYQVFSMRSTKQYTYIYYSTKKFLNKYCPNLDFSMNDDIPSLFLQSVY